MVVIGYLKALIEAVARRAVQVFSFAAYGGLKASLSPAPFPDIGLAYQTLNILDADTVAVPRGIITNLANNSVTFENPGVFSLAITIGMLHTKDNLDRIIYLRAYDIDAALQIGSETIVSIGAQARATNFSVVLLLDILPERALEEIVLQIGGGDIVTNVAFENISFNLWGVGEWKGRFI